ncbi:MAG: hypothetical protein B0D92_08705 [Spirochaeta sp. LUC14_002_19_P3]|nr:MAG: hypothetical protein B0D92_08705 [Spirochaeta sp. LUC14_002_19_P3]
MSIQVFKPESTALAGTMLIEASAGTGKTYALERITARLIGREKNPLSIDSILVVTFTNRAAAEMKERIRSILNQRVKETEAAKGERYRAALSEFDNAAIYTIHSFCRMVLGTWPFESSAPFQQELVPGGEMEREEARAWMASPELNALGEAVLKKARNEAGSSEKLIENTVRFMLDESTPPGAVLLPNDDELEAFQNFLDDAEHPNGKLAQAAAALFGTNWNDSDFTALFKAAGGPNKKGNSLEKIQAHIAACRALNGSALSDAIFADPAEVSINNHFTNLLYAAHTVPENENLSEPGAAQLLAALKALLAVLGPFAEFRAETSGGNVVNLSGRFMLGLFYRHAEKVLRLRVEQRRLKEGNWGYSDLIRRVSMAVSQPDSPLIQVLRKRFQAALIDEFQDTDPRQWQIFRDVFHSPGHLLALIGDPKQSIYGFRGTGLQSYYAARTAVAKTSVYHLDTNYRSRPALTEGVNRLFMPLFQHSSDGSTPIGFLKVKPAPSRERRALIWPEADIPMALIKAASEEDYAAAIVSEIRALLDPASGARWQTEAESVQAVSASDIAVLVRAARHEDDIIGRLSALGVPAIRYRSLSIFTQPVIPALKGLLQAIENPRSQGLWRAVLLDSFFRLPADLLVTFEEAGYLDEFAEKGMELRELFLRGRAAEALESFFRFAVCLGPWARALGRENAADYFEQPWTRRVLAEPGGERTWQDWQHISELIQQKQFEGLGDIPGLLRWLNRCAEESHEDGNTSVRLASESPAVRVMTMHAAKGLEFPLVFLYGGFAGKTKRSSDKPYRFANGGVLTVDRLCREDYFHQHRAYAWEEDKRLWYVAFTRASWKLWAPLPDGKAISQIDSLLSAAFQNDPVEGRLPPHEILASADVPAFRDSLHAALKEAETTGLHICASKPEAPPMPPQAQAASSPPPPLPNAFTGTRDPAFSSFTALIHHSQHELHADNRVLSKIFGDEGPDEDAPYPENLFLAEDKGPVFGTLVHSCFEHCDFALAREEEALWQEKSDPLFRELAGHYYPPDWYRSRGKALKALVRRTLRCPIPELGRLCDMEESSRRREVDFQIHLPEDIPLPELELKLKKGFLTGVIDLLLRADERWWIIDWKTNLPQAGEDYPDIMNRHHYHLQYELYLLGLCRTLNAVSGEPVQWDSIGGAAYLFLRGLNEQNPSGICLNKPSLERMKQLSRPMGEVLI